MKFTPYSANTLVIEHFAAAIVYLVAGALGLLWIAPDLVHGAYLSPRVAGVTHLFTLGWLTLTILGAVCQLLPMALGAPIRSLRVAHASFWILAPGIGVFACGVITSSGSVLAVGGVLVGAGLLLAVGHIAATLVGGRTRDVTWIAIGIGIVFLVSTLVFGLVLALSLHTSLVATIRVRTLTAHLHLALVGWVLVVIVGASRRLMPTFLVARSADARWSPRALAAFTVGVPVLATGLVVASSALSWTGAVLLDIGMAALLWQMGVFYRARTRPRLDVGMRFTLAALPFFGAAAVLGTLLLAVGPSHQRLATAYVVTALLGALVLFVTGILYEIIPTLAWTARYGGRLNRGRVPAVAELYSARLAMAQLLASLVGVILVLGGIAVAAPWPARAGALLFILAVLVFVRQVARMWWGTPTTPRATGQRL